MNTAEATLREAPTAAEFQRLTVALQLHQRPVTCAGANAIAIAIF